MRKLLLLCALLFSSRTFAAGGTCPPGANYINPANPTGSLVTLSSLGITSCYYIAANGLNSNTGLDENHPFQFSPGMNACSSSCSQGLIAPGIGFIFRGGDTWHFGNSGASPYAGFMHNCSTNSTIDGGFCVANSANRGTSLHPIYFGVDPGWFAGGSWVRPIFTGDNPLCNASLVNGSTCLTSGITGLTGGVQYYVNTCPYQVGAQNIFINFNDGGNQIVDNFEVTGMCEQNVGQKGDSHVRYGAIGAPVTFVNLYLHGSTHLQFAGWNGGPNCNSSVVCFSMYVFNGAPLVAPGENILFNVADFSDSDGAAVGLGSPGTGEYNVAYNYFDSSSQNIPTFLHVWHDNVCGHFFENGHSNLIESADISPISAVYNNVLAHVDTSGATGSVLLWLGPVSSSQTTYVFNNVGFDVNSVQYLNNGGIGVTTNNGNYTYFNNTWQSNVNQSILRINGSPIGTVLDSNNHYIDDATQYNLGSPGSWTALKPLLMSNANATTFGYTSGSTFAYAPTLANCNGHPTTCTVGNGSNLASYCATLLASADSLIQAAGTACLSDTTYGVSYNATNHTVSFPARTPVLRPVSGAWDIGAYQFGILPPAPAGTMFAGIEIQNGVTKR